MVQAFKEHRGVRAKASLRLVTEALGPTDWLHGPGDDAAVIDQDDGYLLAAGEAIWPPFVEADPYAAGIAAVLTNVNDIAAMGGRTLAVIDTLVGPEAIARRVLDGMRFAAGLYQVPIAGGHLTVWAGHPALSAFAVGRAKRLLSARNVAPGQSLLFACCLDGRMRDDFPYFSAVEERGAQMAGDVDVLAQVAEAGDSVAAKDVSMAGLLGSLAMLLEPTRAGASVELDRLPRPDTVPLAAWLNAFPSFGFLLCAAAGREGSCRAAFCERGLACEVIGRIDASGAFRVSLAGEDAELVDLTRAGVTWLQGRD